MRTCRKCGCADEAACSLHGVPCFWVTVDLCSGCANIGDVLRCTGGAAWVLLVTAAAIQGLYVEELGE